MGESGVTARAGWTAGVRVGTCSWTDRDLLSSGWYPPGCRDAEGRLRYYASRFPVVEVDAGYYALPGVRNSRLWTERTPNCFRFDVKAFSLLTGHPTPTDRLPVELRAAVAGRRRAYDDRGLLDEVWARFATALEPLRAAGRLGSVLFQFPPWFTPGARAEALLRECRDRTDGWPVSAEFRDPSWWRADRADTTCALLTELEMSTVAVDMTQSLPTSMPPVTQVTSRRLALVRFHGRNEAWGTGSKEERFRHRYSECELEEWIPRIRVMAERADEVHVLFNNCCADAAVSSAESMRRLLGLPEGCAREGCRAHEGSRG
ncbi:DUF72 domain-containing protein [Streptomyces cavernae]|uniref:DUF72 domain-containing protein n=1 Tax=Streptomyces cavernae TaxID=2259034 RepID=UPI000FEC1D4D|nr:DUF72 domain-containing protein [Streptomyces cavernae]